MSSSSTDNLPTYLSGQTRSSQHRNLAQGSDSSKANFRSNNMDPSNMQTRNMPASLSSMQGTTNIPGGSGPMPHDMPEYVWAGDGTKIRNPMLRAMRPGEEKEQFRGEDEDE